MAGDKLSPVGHAIAGSGGAMVALTIVYPLDIIKTRMQVQSSRSMHHDEQNLKTDKAYKSTADGFLKILGEEGIRGLYAGLPGGLIGVASTNFAYFYWYTFLRKSYQTRLGNASISTAMELLLGAGAGALAQIFTIPVSVITTRQQTLPSKERKSMLETGAQIVREDGIQGLWRGLKPSLVLVVNPAITYGMFEKIKEIVLRIAGRDRLTPGLAFLTGALSKTLATIITYPYIMAKVRMQWKPPKDLEGSFEPYKGAIDVLTRVMRENGIAGWYKGMQAQITKAVLSQALLFMIKEELERYTLLLFVLLAGLRTKKVIKA